MPLNSFVDLPENISSETTGNGLLLKKTHKYQTTTEVFRLLE